MPETRDPNRAKAEQIRVVYVGYYLRGRLDELDYRTSIKAVRSNSVNQQTGTAPTPIVEHNATIELPSWQLMSTATTEPRQPYPQRTDCVSIAPLVSTIFSLLRTLGKLTAYGLGQLGMPAEQPNISVYSAYAQPLPLLGQLATSAGGTSQQPTAMLFEPEDFAPV
ncbi:hypothetical protein RhiJN_13020 [Ceratobasidium sp. AG-Ba]|nr:hypothetical protein RhiJN_13020 [Ceratobasidium sp. AG-Ba]